MAGGGNLESGLNEKETRVDEKATTKKLDKRSEETTTILIKKFHQDTTHILIHKPSSDEITVPDTFLRIYEEESKIPEHPKNVMEVNHIFRIGGCREQPYSGKSDIKEIMKNMAKGLELEEGATIEVIVKSASLSRHSFLFASEEDIYEPITTNPYRLIRRGLHLRAVPEDPSKFRYEETLGRLIKTNPKTGQPFTREQQDLMNINVQVLKYTTFEPIAEEVTRDLARVKKFE